MNLETLQKYATDVLRNAKVPNPAGDVRILLAHALDVDATYIMTHGEEVPTDQQATRFDSYITRRAAREPISHIVEKRAFWKHEFYVSGDVLDPRPDSETLIETVLQLYKDESPPKSILEFGVGSGCLLVSLAKELPNTRAVGVDISKKALAIAEKNATMMHCNVELLESNWGEHVSGQFEVIISNPPYIPKADIEKLQPEVQHYEPFLALSGGDTGLEAFSPLFKSIKRLLAEDGLAVLEIGQDQENNVIEIAREYGLHCVQQVKDLAGIIRVLVFRCSTEV